MLYVKTGAGAPADDEVLEAMFAARKSVFVDLLKWNVPVVAGRYEVDQFDDANATYLVLADRTGAHLGSARLLPTTRPHILGDLFPELCAGPVPRGPATFEITRFCLERRLRAGDRRRVRDTLIVAIAKYALQSGISTYTAIAAMGWLQQVLAFGWRCRPLGPPRHAGGELVGALAIEIDASTPARLAAAGIAPPAALLACTLEEPRAAA